VALSSNPSTSTKKKKKDKREVVFLATGREIAKARIECS
jgi:hypothetical protein